MLVQQRDRSGFSIPNSEFRTPNSRKGFTLVEMLVAVALTIAIMGMIGFVMGRTVDTFRNLNAIANMQTKLVTAQTVMKRDLAAEHFGGTFNPAFSGPFVGDQRLDLPGWRPPEQGFFSIYHAGAGGNFGVPENGGVPDNDGLYSTAAVDHTLHFSVRLSGKREEDYIYAFAPANVWNLTSPDFRRTGPSVTTNAMATEWGEVFYFLVANGANANGQPLFTLYRRQRAMQPVGTAAQAWSLANRNNFPDVSCNQALSLVNTPDVIGLRSNRLPLLAAASPGWRTPTYAESLPGGVNNAQAGNDILMTDVISFEIRAYWYTGPASITPNENMVVPGYDGFASILPVSPRNGAYPAGRRAFDTWSVTESPSINWDDSTSFNNAVNNPPPLRIRLTTLQIRIRVWDFNTNQARQVCFVQDI